MVKRIVVVVLVVIITIAVINDIGRYIIVWYIARRDHPRNIPVGRRGRRRPRPGSPDSC